MDFFTMKRKKLQSLCKKHGIPANLKNKDMAEKLSLIYKEEENENPGSRRLRSDANNSNVEIIVLDSDSDSDVQMEDTVAEKECNEKTNVSAAEHLLDEEPDQVLTSSPLSEVKSDFNVPHTDDSGIAAGNADACEMKLPAPSDFNICHIVDSDVKLTDEVNSSDLNNLMSCPIRSDEDKSNLEITESDIDNDTDAQMEASDTVAEKDSNEKTDVRAGDLIDKETDLTPSPLGLEGFGNYFMLRDFQTSSESTDIHEDTDVHQGSVEQVPKLGDYHCAISQAATTYLDASPGAKSTEDNTNVNVQNTLDEVHSSSFGDSDGTPVQFLKTNPLSKVDTSDLDADKMVVTGTATKNAYTSGSKFELSQKMCISPASKEIVGSSTKLLNNSVSPKDTVFHHVEESIQIGSNKEQVDPSQEKMTEFSPKLFNNPGIPTNGDIGLCGLKENMEIGVNKENIDPNEGVMLAEPCALVMSHNEDLIQTVSEELGDKLMEENLEIGVNKENIDPNEDVMHAEPSAIVISKNEDLIQAVPEELDSNLMEDDIGICGLEENLEIGVKKENIDPNEDVMLAEPCALVMSHNEDLLQTVSEELGNKLMEENLEIGVNKENIDHNEDVMHAEPSAMVISKNEDLIQAVPEELDSNLMEDDIGICGLEENLEIGVKKENIDPNEDVMLGEPCALVMSHNEDVLQTVSEELGNKLMEENLEIDVNKENIDHNEDVIHAEPSAMVISKNEETSDPLREAETSDLDAHKMFETATATKNADTSGVKFESLPKTSLSPTPEKMINSSTKLLNVDENLWVGANKENIDPSDEVLRAERSFVIMSDDEELDLSTYQMDALGTAAGNADAWEVKPATPSDHNVHDMIDSGTATKSAYTSGAKFESSQKMSTSPASKEIVGSSTKLLNNSATPRDVVFCNVEESVQIGANKEQVDPSQEKMMEFSPKLFNNPGSPTNGDIGFCSLEENLEIGVNKENIDPNEDAKHAEPSAMVMSDNEDLIRAVSEELGKNLMEDEVANVDDKFDLLENVPGSVNPGGRNSTQGSNINTDLNTYGTGGDLLNEVLSTSVAESAGSPVQFQPTDPLREAETSDLDVHQMFETATATKNADTSGVKFESAPKMSLSPTPEKMIGSSTELLGVDKEQVDRVVMSDDEEVDLSIYPMAALEACEEEMLKSSEKTCMVADPEECFGFSLNDLEASTTKGSEAETYFESTTLGDVMETCNLEGSMQTNMMEEENHLEDIGRGGAEDDNSGANSDEEVKADELVPAVPQSSEMESCDFGLQELFAQDTVFGDEYENPAYSASQKRKRSDTDDTSGASSEEEGKAVELVPTMPQSSEIDSYSFSLQQLFAQDTASGDQDACQNSPSKATPIASGEKSLIFTPKFNESSLMRKKREIPMIEEENNQEEEMDIAMIEKENNQEVCISAQRVSKFFDTSDENQAYLTSRKRKMSDLDDTSGGNSDEVKADELFPAVAQSSEMESCDFGLQQLFAQDGSKDENQACSASWKRKMSEVDVTSGANSDEEVKADELFPAVAQSSEIESRDFGPKQLFAQDGSKDENQACSASWKRKMSEVDVTSGANSDEEVKADELFPAVAQSSEMESCDFGPKQLFAQDGSKDENQACSASRKRKMSEVDVTSGPNSDEEVKADELFPAVAQSSEMESRDFGLKQLFAQDGSKDENQACSVSRKRKMSEVDVTSGASPDEEVKADELFPAVAQSSEMESPDFGLEQLFAQDTASEDEDAYQEKLDSSSTGTPIASGEKNIIFTPKLHESSMMHKKMRIGMNSSQKPAARDSDMKENIKIDKKEDFSSTVLRNKFAKRLPLQNLHQN
ncbi:unnamed protein product [Vicia faba]|uniref:SAP domain-containing protein n=1 Tax=Vicia faba TaxID=3906 RepID=A0AAV0Z7T7_VICFA|nr:unnamed protein product [Vicia faba]